MIGLPHAGVPAIARNAHNRISVFGTVEQCDLVSQRVRMRKITVSEGLVDDRCSIGPEDIHLIEIAAPMKWNSERVQEIGSNCVEHAWALPALRGAG